MGGLGFTAFNALFYVAAHHTTALNISLIQAAIPAFVLGGAAVFFGLRASPAQTLGAVVTIVGVAVIASQGDFARLSALTVNDGDALLLLCSFLYAGYTLGLRKRPPVSGLGFFTAMAIVAFLTSTPLFIFEIWRGDFVWPSTAGYFLLLYAAILPSLLSQIFFMTRRRFRQSRAGLWRFDVGRPARRGLCGLSCRRAGSRVRGHRRFAAPLLPLAGEEGGRVAAGR
jgi:drug/metabolite transporter (DMT)-like permease